MREKFGRIEVKTNLISALISKTNPDVDEEEDEKKISKCESMAF